MLKVVSVHEIRDGGGERVIADRVTLLTPRRAGAEEKPEGLISAMHKSVPLKEAIQGELKLRHLSHQKNHPIGPPASPGTA